YHQTLPKSYDHERRGFQHAVSRPSGQHQLVRHQSDYDESESDCPDSGQVDARLAGREETIDKRRGDKKVKPNVLPNPDAALKGKADQERNREIVENGPMVCLTAIREDRGR